MRLKDLSPALTSIQLVSVVLETHAAMGGVVYFLETEAYTVKMEQKIENIKKIL